MNPSMFTLFIVFGLIIVAVVALVGLAALMLAAHSDDESRRLADKEAK